MKGGKEEMKRGNGADSFADFGSHLEGKSEFSLSHQESHLAPVLDYISGKKERD